MSDEFVEVDIEVKRKSSDAIYVTDGYINVWLPLSQLKIVRNFKLGSAYTIEIPEWLAIKKELI